MDKANKGHEDSSFNVNRGAPAPPLPPSLSRQNHETLRPMSKPLIRSNKASRTPNNRNHRRKAAPPRPPPSVDGGVDSASVSAPAPPRIIPAASELALLPREFFQVDALDLAPRLLGKLLRRDDVVLRITEVEAYRPNDTACHGRFGITARTAPVFGPGGHAYVYLCYGLHTMLNVVADKVGVGAAVLIRSCAPVNGLEVIQQRRGQKTEKPVLLAGPGKVAQALGLSTAWSNHPLYTPGGLEVLYGPEPDHMLIGPRVGINYASPEHVTAPWRFAIAGSPWISTPKSTLSPQVLVNPLERE